MIKRRRKENRVEDFARYRLQAGDVLMTEGEIGTNWAGSPSGTIVHLEGFGIVKGFRIATTDGGTEHWITNDLRMDELTRRVLAEHAWGIEEYYRGLKQFVREAVRAYLARPTLTLPQTATA